MSNQSKQPKAFLPIAQPLPVAPVFSVGPFQYTLSVAPGPLHEDGRTINVAWLESSREIVLAGDCPSESRMSSILYALMRAWISHTGAPDSEDGWCDLSATAMEQFARDLAASTVNLNHILPAA